MPLDFLSTLGNILGAVFDKVLSPILTTIFEALFKIAWLFIMELLTPLIMRLLIIILKILDFLQSVFDKFAGTGFIHYNDGVKHLAEYGEVYADTTIIEKGQTYIKYKQISLQDLFLTYGPVVKVFQYVTAIAVVVSFAFTIYSVAKSIHDMAFDGKNPVGAVLKRAFKAALTFCLVPAFIMFMMQLTTLIINTVEDKITADEDGQPSIGTMVFLMGGMEAVKGSPPSGGQSINNGQLAEFWNEKEGYDYKNYLSEGSDSKVSEVFDITKYNYITAAVCALCLIVMMISAIFLFIRRLFEIAILYIISPMFVCTMPMDDGAMFSKWRDMFVGKMFVGFGPILVMKLYFMIMPKIMSTDIVFSTTNQYTDTIFKMFVLIGGVYAMYTSQFLILKIINPAAGEEAESGSGMGLSMLKGGFASITKK